MLCCVGVASCDSRSKDGVPEIVKLPQHLAGCTGCTDRMGGRRLQYAPVCGARRIDAPQLRIDLGLYYRLFPGNVSNDAVLEGIQQLN